MILNRTQFALHFEQIQPGMGKQSSPLWAPEEYLKVHQSTSFICVKPINLLQIGKAIYWDWCKQHLQGRVLCYSSDIISEQEWWGFSNPDDIVFWLLRWTR